jgi:hypothetical protein
MASFSQAGPWITVAVLFSAVIFFGVFYITKLIQISKEKISSSTHGKRSDDIGVMKTIISKEQKKKLKDEIVHDIVADITPVLEKRLEKAF